MDFVGLAQEAQGQQQGENAGAWTDTPPPPRTVRRATGSTPLGPGVGHYFSFFCGVGGSLIKSP